MATEYIKTVKPDGSGDYTTTSAWQIGVQGLIGGNLLSADKIAVAECYGGGDCSGGSDFIISGWTNDATHRVIIRGAVGQKHNGVWDDNKAKFLNGINLASGSIQSVWIDGLQLSAGSSGGGISMQNFSGGGWVSNCILKGSSGTGYGWLRSIAVAPNSEYRIWNNIFYNWGNGYCSIVCMSGHGAGTANYYIYNNTLVSSSSGAVLVSNGDSTVYAKNNIAYDTAGSQCFNTDPYGIYHSLSSNNISNDGTAVGVNSHTYTIPTFLNYAGRDLRLSSSDLYAKEGGIDLSADTYLPFNTDCRGLTRPSGSAWDIGAYEYESAPLSLYPFMSFRPSY